MTNAEIRKRARGLYRRHAGKLLLMNLGVSLVYALLQMVVLGAGESWISVAAMLLVAIVAAPVVVLGIYAASQAAWRGEAPGAGQLFRFIRTPALLGRSIRLLLLIALAMLGVYFLGFVADVLALYIFPPLIYVVQVALSIAGIWVEIRFFLAPWLFALDSEAPASQYVGQSFRMMKGYVGRYIGFMLGTIWWPVLLILAAAIAAAMALTPIEALMQAQFSLWTYAVLWGGMALFFPYLYLAQAGFAQEIIDSANGAGGAEA